MKMTNLLSHEVNQFILLPGSLVSESEITSDVLIDYYMEVLNDIYDCNVISPDKSLEKLELIKTIFDPDLKAAAMASLGGVHTFVGNYVKAFSSFQRAISICKNPEIKAFVYSEMSMLLRKLGYKKEALSILKVALNTTRNELLMWRIKTQIGLCHKYTDSNISIEILNESLRYYESTGNVVRIARIKRHLGSIYIHLRDFKNANRCFNEALNIAVDQSLINYQYDVMNDKAWMWIQQEKYEKAQSLYMELLQKNLSSYQMSLALENMGYIDYKSGNYHQAVKQYSQSLQLTTRYEMRDLVFEDYYYLGSSYEKLIEIGMADHFYSQGYIELQKEIDIGLRIIGFRKKLLYTYIEFLRMNQRIPHVDVKEKVFEFAMNKTLKEIREIFHKSLSNLHLERTRNAPELCKKLNIDTRTYFIYQKRLGLKRGAVQRTSSDVNPYFNEYVESLIPLTWREGNRKFENDLFSYLLAKYQNNKKKLAEVLEVSYGQVAQKTMS